MSALAAWEVVPTHAPVRDRRAHLRLVPARSAAHSPAHSAARPSAPSRGGAGRAALRLTRAGRLVLALALAAVAVLVLAGTVGAARGAAPAPTTVTVQAGQTLSELAVIHLPQLPIREGVAQLQLANGLNTPAIHAGQRLVIPALP